MYSDSEDEGDECEYAARSWDKSEALSTKRRLPTKTQSGDVLTKPIEKRAKIVKDVAVEEDQANDDAEHDAILDDDDEAETESNNGKTGKRTEKKKNDDDKKEEEEEEVDEETALMQIAAFSNAILSNEPNSIKPEGVKMKAGVAVAPEPTAMERLLGMCRSAKIWTVRKAALLSLLAVFKDVLPTEYVRELSEAEQKSKMTKETRLQRSTEKALLNQYRLFLAILFEGARNAPWEVGKSYGTEESIARRGKISRLSVYCLCNLMESRPNFNFYDEILKVVLPRTSSPDSKTARICVESIARAVEDDASFECALNVIKSCGRMYERKKSISPQALEAISKLRLSMDLKDEKRMDLIAQAKKERQKRRRKYGTDLAKVLEDTEITMTRNHEIMQRQVEIIRDLFTLYLRIFTDASEAEVFLKRPLTSEALKGATRLVSLVNIEFVHGLVRILSTFFANEDHLSSVEVALQTCETGLTAMTLLSRPELRTKTTASEEVYFTKLLLRCIARLSEDERAVVHISSVMKCVSILFTKRREADPKVVSDFCVRLVNAAVRVPAHFALGLLSLERRLLEAYPAAKDIVLGTVKSAEEEACGPLIPVAYAVDSVGTEARPSWELALLASKHYHPAVRKFAHDARLGKANFNDRPVELISLHHPLDGEVFFPMVGPGMRPSLKSLNESSESQVKNKQAGVKANNSRGRNAQNSTSNRNPTSKAVGRKSFPTRGKSTRG